jgi:phenylalanyl-tRNA synthetase beta chain
MPTISIDLKELTSYLGEKISKDKIEETLFYFGCELEGIEENSLIIEINSNRPDLFSKEGLFRALSFYLGKKSLKEKYHLRPSGISIKVDKSITPIRPFIASAVLKGIDFTDEKIRSMIEYQELLHSTFCRKRKLASIGVYVLDLIKPPLHYFAALPENIEFVPLGMDEKLSAKEILELHPTGRDYAHLLSDFDQYPLFTDSERNVLSMPPIINSNDLGQVKIDTKNILLEITGTDLQIVNQTLTLLTTALGESAKTIESVKIEYPDRVVFTPQLNYFQQEVSIDYINKNLGLKLEENEIRSLFTKMGLFVNDITNGKVIVDIPPYRTDFLHPIDLVEEIAISFGYNKFKPTLPQFMTKGSELPISSLIRTSRDIFIGLTFQEVLNYTLTSPETLYKKMSIPLDKIVELKNPVSEKYSVVRSWLIPILLEYLVNNKHLEYPQQIFEIGPIVKIDSDAENKSMTEIHLSAVIADRKVRFSDIHNIVSKYFSLINCEYSIDYKAHESFIETRCACINRNGSELGFFGEIHPTVLEAFGLEMPVGAIELNLNLIYKTKD